MKNPMMSAWLSAANSVVGVARGQMMAEFSRTQTQMMQEWQRAWMAAWVGMWLPGGASKHH
ncbi:hypothetical protein [Paracoccus salsus]|uniref:hypothetical protein n=1 Tax=Paracoccus salsus TaxID=2911061 RepID=UPI001F44C7D0|nr:hypothetical protein [Paracoccus salsus]MCF3974041.1 hypothetical protein [Paracoccus salsus]